MVLNEKGGYPAAENGTAVTADMIGEWSDAYDNGKLPAGYAPDGPSRSGRPKLVDGEMATLTIRIPLAQKEALVRGARERGISLSCYARELLSLRD